MQPGSASPDHCTCFSWYNSMAQTWPPEAGAADKQVVNKDQQGCMSMHEHMHDVPIGWCGNYLRLRVKYVCDLGHPPH